jgi:hypothetical protein
MGFSTTTIGGEASAVCVIFMSNPKLKRRAKLNALGALIATSRFGFNTVWHPSRLSSL